jgi:tetratricopeptide (TPR) repeat protein
MNSNSLERSGFLSKIIESKNIIAEGQIIYNRPFLEETIEQCLRFERFKSAHGIIAALLKVFPYDASLWNKKSTCLLALKRYDNAFRASRKAVQLDSVNTEYQINLATVYLATGYAQQAKEIFDRIQSQNSIDSELYIKITDIYITYAEYATALEYTDRILELIPDSPDALFNKALCLEYMEDYQAALESYDCYLAVESNCATGWYNRGIVLEQLKNHFEALESYRRSVTIDESIADSWFNLGNLYADMDDYNQAIDSFKKVINLDVKNSSAYYNLGILYEDLHDYKQAIYFYSKSLQNDNKFQEAYLGRGNCLYKTNDLENALQDFRAALASDNTPGSKWNIPASTSDISIDETYLLKIRAYENRGIRNLDTIEYSELIQNYIAVGKYEAAVTLISSRENSSLSSNDIFLLAKIHFMRNNNHLGYLYLNKSFYINKELIEIFSKMFPRVTSSRLFNELFGFKK